MVERPWGGRARRPIADLSDPRGFGRLGHEFLSWCHAHDYSPYTLDGWERALRAFAGWAVERGITRPAEVTLPVLERYQRYLAVQYKKEDGRPLSVRSQRVQLMSLKSFFRWATRQRHLLSNPASELVLPRKVKRLPRAVLTIPEVEQVLAVPDVTTPIGLRNRAMLETLYATGIRRSELVGLEISDVDTERGTLLVREGKGRKDRMLPLGERAAAWVELYLRESRPRLVVPPEPRSLFVSRWGKRLGPSAATEMARQAIRASGITKKGSCHLFRHTVATLMLERGADIRYIQQMLGHSDLTTTEIYTQVTVTKLKEVYAATHPAARLERLGRSEGEPMPADPVELLEAILDAEEDEDGEDDVAGEEE